MAGTAERRSEWPLALCCVTGLTGLVVLTFDDWRKGVLIFSAGVLLGGLLRMVLSDDAAGLLRVRSRMFDIAVLFGIGVAILVLGLIVPN